MKPPKLADLTVEFGSYGDDGSQKSGKVRNQWVLGSDMQPE